jgi:DNA-binding beta-propeller fold protein YncE
MKPFTLAAALLGTTLLAGAAQAQTVAALVGDDTLALVDVMAKKADKSMKVSGLSGRLLGIDVRPADGMLYGLVSDGTIVTIDTATGKATQKSKLDAMLADGVTATVDFNPAADRLRIIGSDGSNLRANVDDGKVTKDGQLKFAEADMHKGKAPKIVAGAYTNSVKGAKETALFDIDATGALVKQAPPNDGVLNSVGMIGMSAEAAAFDIVASEVSGQSQNTGWLMAGDTLYKVDLASGKATAHGKIAGVAGPVRDIAALPQAM